MTVTISKLYNSYGEARAVVDSLEASGVSHNDISVLASNADDWYSKPGTGAKSRDASTFPDRDLDGRDDRAESAGAGAGIGAAVGGTAGLLAGLGLLAIPGVGPVVAAGWLVATLTGAVAGGAAGGIIGGLTQAGISHEDADIYAEGLRRGGAVVIARVESAEAARVQSIMGNSAINPTERAAVYRKAGWTKFDPAAKAYTADQVRAERDMYRKAG